MLRASPGPRPGLSATEPGAGLTRRLADRLGAYQAGRIGFSEFDASVQGWINHVRYAGTWGLREHVLGGLRFTQQP